MKRIVCKPAPELEIELSGGEVVLLRFDLNSLAELQEFEGGLNGVFKKSIVDIAALIVYASAKNNNENIDLNKARTIVSCMSVDDITELTNSYSEAMGIEKNEAQGEYAKKIMAQFIASLK